MMILVVLALAFTVMGFFHLVFSAEISNDLLTAVMDHEKTVRKGGERAKEEGKALAGFVADHCFTYKNMDGIKDRTRPGAGRVERSGLMDVGAYGIDVKICSDHGK
ncbi:MAG: hypothetical protein PHH49_06620 [Candidatus Omnitrophica bacterium]|nr:hypothetical protein [Candidatus Omnitrophota bacterium]MDD5488613.1 hypothetical protein [Candidatus Omnitrophota bacterium]